MNQLQKQFNVFLIGDDCIDEYHYGTTDRLSPEAPIPIFCPKTVETKKGMAGNVENNLLNLGLHVHYYHTERSVKQRMIHERSKQHLLRIDRDVVCTPLMYEHINFSGADAVVISDYNKGTVTYELIDEIQENINVPIFLDTKKRDLHRFNKSIVKINELEYKNRISEGENVIVTHGGSAVEYNGKFYVVPVVPVFDVCGAGDTFLASLVYKYLHTNSIDDAIEFAIKASVITVQHMGVYAPTLGEIV